MVGTERTHPTAVIEPGSSIASKTFVWHHAHIRSGAAIGADCVIGKNVFVDTGVTIGDRCKLQNNVSVFQGVTIGDDVFVGPSATFTNDRAPRAFNSDWKIIPTAVDRGASVGANATILCGVTLGEYCMVAAGAVVTRDVEPYQLVVGNPARHLGWVCQCGTVVSRESDAPIPIRCESCQEVSS